MAKEFNLYSKDSRGSDPYKSYKPSENPRSSSSGNSTTASVAGTIAKSVVTNVVVAAVTGVPVLGADTAIGVVADIIADSL